MAPTPEISDISCYTPVVSQKNELLSKWNLVFSKNTGAAWISFKPQLGVHVFPCYACRDMFASKITFQDHANRRAIMIKYDCKDCDQTLTFYNRCSFLLHARNHFTLFEGKIDLTHLEIFSLPFGMMGFLPHPGISQLYDVDEDTIEENYYVNAQFYSPEVGEKGKQIITLKPNDLLFCSTTEDSRVVQLTLKQISNNIPLCQFVTVDYQKKLRQNCFVLESVVRVKEELPHDLVDNPVTMTIPQDHIQMPVISKIESLCPEDPNSTYQRCPECDESQRCSMRVHFTGKNLPLDENLKCSVCKYVASTKCSFSAHERVHANVAPFVCPECGKKFESRDYLMCHLEDACFHLAKQIRIRCPGKKCGNLFATPTTFSVHFTQHIHTWLQCTACKETFEGFLQFTEHAKIHSNLCFSDKVYKCLGCKTEDSVLLQEMVPQHIEFHSNDRTRCMYVFICKFCKNYFRSPLTYATHLLKCHKVRGRRKQDFLFTLESCSQCNNKIIFYENENISACTKCRCLNMRRPTTTNVREDITNQIEDEEAEVNVCILCKEQIQDKDVRNHPLKCVYRNPQIVVKKLNEKDLHKTSSLHSDSSNDSMESENGDLTNKSTEHDVVEQFKIRPKSSSPKSQDSSKRKRKRAPFVFRVKKPMLSCSYEETVDLQAEEAKPFDGTYHCKLCQFTETEREKFHEHIIIHRDISTSYQCMECGECFVVKPSLIKHLLHYHKIEDTSGYMESNNCYDRSAVEELKEVMKLAPGESRGPVKENQCRVCLQQFCDGQELSKHFRIHGMAFLMKNTRDC